MRKLLSFMFMPIIVVAEVAIVAPMVDQPKVESLDFLQQFILSLAGKYPWILSVLAVIGIIRVINKPLFSLLRNYVNTTSSTKDNDLLDSVEKSTAYKVIVYLLDWFFSIKPAKK